MEITFEMSHKTSIRRSLICSGKINAFRGFRGNVREVFVKSSRVIPGKEMRLLIQILVSPFFDEYLGLKACRCGG